MKLLIIHNKEMSEVTLGADSAVLRPSEPLFLDISRQSFSSLVPAVRIGRLGFHIPLTAAENHVDATSVFHILKEPNSPCPAGLADRTFFPGSWFSGVSRDFRLSATVNNARTGAMLGKFEKRIENLPVQEAVSTLSRWCTLKTGDVILFASEALDIGHTEIDTEIKALMDTSSVLNLRIK